MNTRAEDDYKLFLNVLAQDEDGIAGDIINKWAKAKAMTHALEQQKMIPPPLPPELNTAQTSPQTTGAPIISQPDQSANQGLPTQ
jgi:hypothetical protein